MATYVGKHSEKSIRMQKSSVNTGNGGKDYRNHGDDVDRNSRSGSRPISKPTINALGGSRPISRSAPKRYGP